MYHFFLNTIYFFIYRNMQYINRSNEEEFMSFSNFPTSLEKKVKLLNYFRTYMSEHLLKVSLLKDHKINVFCLI